MYICLLCLLCCDFSCKMIYSCYNIKKEKWVLTPSKVEEHGFICYLPLTCEGHVGVCSGLSERGAEGPAAMVGTGMPIHCVLKGCKIQQTIKSCFLEAGTMIQKISPSVPVYV